jgi:hypothetical protein
MLNAFMEANIIISFYFCCFLIIFCILSSCLSKRILVPLPSELPLHIFSFLPPGVLCWMHILKIKFHHSRVLKERKLYKLFTSWHTHHYIIDRLQLRQIQHIINVNFHLCFKNKLLCIDTTLPSYLLWNKICVCSTCNCLAIYHIPIWIHINTYFIQSNELMVQCVKELTCFFFKEK